MIHEFYAETSMTHFRVCVTCLDRSKHGIPVLESSYHIMCVPLIHIL